MSLSLRVEAASVAATKDSEAARAVSTPTQKQ